MILCFSVWFICANPRIDCRFSVLSFAASVSLSLWISCQCVGEDAVLLRFAFDSVSRFFLVGGTTQRRKRNRRSSTVLLTGENLWQSKFLQVARCVVLEVPCNQLRRKSRSRRWWCLERHWIWIIHHCTLRGVFDDEEEREDFIYSAMMMRKSPTNPHR